VHVNVPPRLLAQQSFATTFLDRCEALGAPPDQLVIEIIETDLLAPDALSLDNLERLRRAGTKVSIDDFGTGYSSLVHLLELPVDGVKIDQRFVAGLDIDPAATNLTTAIVSLSKSLRLDCIAEGVEQPYQAQRLVELGCTTFQGWLYSRAVPAADVLALLPRIDQSSQRLPV
jgi:EAL domain-containing protein (putative c-di-GMP-specific phosphodiesterase class I)